METTTKPTIQQLEAERDKWFTIAAAAVFKLPGDMLVGEIQCAAKEIEARLKRDAKDAARYQQLKIDPSSARHLLHLLEMGKGTAEDFDTMIDRITIARESRTPRGIGPI